MKKIPLMIFFVITTLNIFSQVRPPDPSQRPGPGLPINQGQILLISIGLIYAIGKIKKYHED